MPDWNGAVLIELIMLLSYYVTTKAHTKGYMSIPRNLVLTTYNSTELALNECERSLKRPVDGRSPIPVVLVFAHRQEHACVKVFWELVEARSYQYEEHFLALSDAGVHCLSSGHCGCSLCSIPDPS